MNLVEGDAGSEHQYPEVYLDTTVTDNGEQAKPVIGNEAGVEEETSCSSSFASEEDFFQLDPTQLCLSISHGDIAQEVTTQSGAATDISAGGAGTDTCSIIEQRQSPPVQTMERSDVLDPDRIPSSIFTRTKSTPQEWSAASNESLFSINVGNSSFSREHVVSAGKCGDYPQSPMESNAPTSAASGLNHVETDAQQGSMEPAAAEAANAEAMNHVLLANAEGHAKNDQRPAEGATLPGCLSHRSDESFAFPILTGERKSASLKVEPGPPSQPEKEEQPPEQQPETPKAAPPPAGEKKWFSCFSCCSSCC